MPPRTFVRAFIKVVMSRNKFAATLLTALALSSIASDSLRIGSVHPVRAGVDSPPPDGRKEVDSELLGEALGCQLAANPVAGCVQGRRVGGQTTPTRRDRRDAA